MFPGKSLFCYILGIGDYKEAAGCWILNVGATILSSTTAIEAAMGTAVLGAHSGHMPKMFFIGGPGKCMLRIQIEMKTMSNYSHSPQAG